jgi:hypothetical protein
MHFLNLLLLLLPLLAFTGVSSLPIHREDQPLPEGEQPIPPSLRSHLKSLGMLEPQGPGWTYACHTTGASPTFSEIEGVVILLTLFKKNKVCYQWNGVGSLCKVQASYYGGAASLCGKYGQEVMCKDLGDTIQWLGKQCAKNGKASGYLVLNKNLRAVLH